MIDFWNILKINFKNIPGKKVDSRFIVFESDDWGGIRMPSQDVYNQLIKADIPIGGKFDIYDTLADKQDLDDLFEVLLSVRDKNNHPAVFTPVTNVANPDFRRIKDSGKPCRVQDAEGETLILAMILQPVALWGPAQRQARAAVSPEYEPRNRIITVGSAWSASQNPAG